MLHNILIFISLRSSKSNNESSSLSYTEEENTFYRAFSSPRRKTYEKESYPRGARSRFSY